MSTSSVVSIQLVLVRSLFDRAQSAASENTPIGNMTAMLLADVAVETVLKEALMEHQRLSTAKDENLADLLEKLAKVEPTLANTPEMAMARKLRAARNPVQHSGSIPDASSVTSHIRDANRFISVLVKKVFNHDFASVSAVQLVRSEDIRMALQAAQSLLAQGNFVDSAVQIAAAFIILRVRWANWISVALGGHYERLVSYSPRIIHHAVFQAFEKHPDALEPQHEEPLPEMALLSMGFPLVDLILLRKFESYGSKAAQQKTEEGPPVDAEGLAFAIEAMARNTWRLEAAHPELFATAGQIQNQVA